MKIKRITRFFQMTAMMAFLVLIAGNAFAIENKSRVVSPYWQSDSTSYSFIAVSHPSLSGMASQIGLTINAIQKDKSAFGTATTFTITAGSTTRVFIVRTNHATINPTSISSAKFVTGTTDFQHGHVRVDPIATSTNIKTITNNGDGFRDVTMLEFWGAVVIETNTTGFAMEFIGDQHDSAAAPTLHPNAGVGGVAAP